MRSRIWNALRWVFAIWLVSALIGGIFIALINAGTFLGGTLQSAKFVGIVLGVIAAVLALVYTPPIWLIRKWWARYRVKNPFNNDQYEKSLAKFIANNSAMFGLVTITFALLVAIFCYWIAPDGTQNANRQVLEIEKEKPGFQMNFLLVRTNRAEQNISIFEKLWKGDQSNFRDVPLLSYAVEGDSLIVEAYRGKSRQPQRQAFGLVNVVYAKSFQDPEVVRDGDVYRFRDIHENQLAVSRTELIDIIEQKQIVSRRFWFGTDQEGRDYLSRIMIGTRISMSVGILAVTVALLIGLVLGSVAGYFRGWIDNLILWFINVFWSIPTLLLVFPIAFAFGMKEWTIFLAVGLTMWVGIARIVRGQVLSVRELEYVEAARSLGFSNTRIIFRHILPNISGPIIVITAANFAYAILIEAGLSFLGIGAQPPKPSWGQMIARNKDNIAYGDPQLALIPGFAIVLLVLSFFLIGNGLRDALDAKTRIEQ